MGTTIAETEEFSTWGKCRTPIFNTYFGWADGDNGNHNLVGDNAYVSQANTFFRCAKGPQVIFWIDGNNDTQTAFVGAFAFPGPPFPNSPQFYIGTFNPDTAEFYAPNNLDDVEIQAYWVGRNVLIDSTNYSMAYSALNGEQGSFQTISPSASVISFDL